MQHRSEVKPQNHPKHGASSRQFAPIGLLAALICTGILAAGCHNQENAPPVKAMPSADEMKQKTKAEGANVDDMTVIPAPAGQKTGLEGGKK